MRLKRSATMARGTGREDDDGLGSMTLACRGGREGARMTGRRLPAQESCPLRGTRRDGDDMAARSPRLPRQVSLMPPAVAANLRPSVWLGRAA